MKENNDPKFKFHIIYAMGWLIGGILILLWATNPNDCNLDVNPLCPKQVLEFRIFSITIWCMIIGTFTGLRIMVHHYKMNNVSTLQNSNTVEGKN